MHKWLLVWLWAIAYVAAADLYQSYPVDSVKQGKEEYGKIKEAAQTESVVDYIFGTDCYSKAVRSLDKGCKLMTPDEHSTLAFLLTNCFLDHSGRRTMRCAGNNIRDCTSSMDEEAFSTYQHFFINIYNICIFLENDNFQKQTEHLVQKLYRSTDDIFGRMVDMKDKLDQQEGQMKGLSSQVLEVSKMQRLVEEGVTRGIQEVVSLQKSAANLEHQMNTSLQVEMMLYDRQLQLIERHESHEQMEAARASRVESHFQMFEDFQQRMMEWQQRYQEMQDHLLSSSETLMSRSNDLQDTLIKLLDYEAKTEKAIRQVLGRSFRVYDLAVYIIGMVVGLALGNVKKTHGAGGPVFAVFCVGLLIHRFLSDTWNHVGLLDSDGGWFSYLLMMIGSEFHLGWLIQCSCVCISGFLVARTSFTDGTTRMDQEEFYTISKQLRKSEKYIRALAAGQKKMDEYIKQRLDTGSGVSTASGAYRFSSSNAHFQTAFQRHICNLAVPASQKYRSNIHYKGSEFPTKD